MIPRTEARDLNLLTEDMGSNGNGSKIHVLHPEPAIDGMTMVTFCGEEFCVEALMEVPPRQTHTEGVRADVAEFVRLVDELEAKAREASKNERRESEPVMMESGKSDFFMRALNKIAHRTAWLVSRQQRTSEQVITTSLNKFNGALGYSLRVILPV